MEEMQSIAKTSFLEVLGDAPINKVMDFLIENDRESWSMNEISENANVGYSTLKILLPKMVENKLIAVTKKLGKIKLYQINKKSMIVKKVYKLYHEINRAYLDQNINI